MLNFQASDKKSADFVLRLGRSRFTRKAPTSRRTLKRLVRTRINILKTKESAVSDIEAKTAELRRIQSKYAHLSTSSDAFAARKAEEIELEDRRR